MNPKYENKPIEIEICIPSGKIAFGNDFREQYQEPEERFNYNQTSGIKAAIEHYGDQGLLHGFVGNSCPNIYQTGNKLTIGHLSGKRKKVGEIVTDLWWYSLADYDDYVSRGGDPKVEFINVDPGRYVLTHRLNSSGWDKTPCVYATLDRSDKAVHRWKLPEEGVADALLKMLPESLQSPKNYIYVDEKFDHCEKKLVHSGYSIWGKIQTKSQREKPTRVPSNFQFRVKESWLKDKKLLVKKLVKALEVGEKMEVLYKKLNNKESLTEKEKILLLKSISEKF